MPTPDPKRPLKVFLCHAHADRDSVRALYTRLTNDGVDAWLDKEKLLGGQNWRMEIRTAVEVADVVVVCHSKEFNKEGFRQREVKWALDAAMEKPEGTIFIIPARLEECEVIKSLSDWHWVDLFEDDGYEMLMRALRARADRIGATQHIKRSWMPKITSPIPKKQKTVGNKSAETLKEKNLNTKDDTLSSPELPDGWESQWQAAFVKNAKEEKETAETTDTKVDRPSTKKASRPNTTLIVTFIVLVMASIFGLPSLFDAPMDSVPTATQTKGIVVLETQTPKPSSTPLIPTSTKTPSYTVTPIPLSTEITDAKGVSMMLVPAGEFKMGSDELYRVGPAHTVYLDVFYIDKYEVSNAEYAKCVADGECIPPQQINSLDVKEYYGNPDYDSYPVIYVTWDMANSYCTWRGNDENVNIRLPTEAEWEKSARSIDERRYPWGDSKFVLGGNFCDMRCPSSWDADIDDGYRELAPVSSFAKGISPYGAYNMAGNVWEWVADWFIAYEDEYPDVLLNPLGSQSGTVRVARGGSWKSLLFQIETAYRMAFDPLTADNNLGFRCAMDIQ